MTFVNCQIVEPEVEETFSGREISFKVKKTMMGRIGKKSELNPNHLNERSSIKSPFIANQ